ncbi:putative retrotransposon hot spot protein (RHS) [Trypanosoma cruzi]|uniref:Putative retrotransposon hot spot protein (RHS) n=1 Tax=Trypanosoma cruzi TaxID=5693 RepID=A0A2V2W6P0_TRYCR|nr:putative retrotransposon hot spot protein (RHS) [Trypanosoma cruzi]RNC42989.1 putative retrotransposon hot spot (RHS) protein [Trypanosoma cruzi]
MPGKRKRVQGDDNTEFQGYTVPQGDCQTRARLSSDDETDQPAATHIRVEETQRPQWTMRSTVEDILLEGKERITKMWLSDFLRNYFDGRGVGELYINVTMKEFLISPNEVIKDEVLLDTIKASPPYQELKKEREEYYVLLKPLYKLKKEHIVTLRHWSNFKKKDTVTPLARSQINKAYSQILREERREAEEKARRERKQLGIDVSTWIKAAVLKGRVRVNKMRLNDFLTMELDGRGALDANQDVLLEEFFKDPEKYICDAGVLNEMQASDRYKRMERAVRDEMDMAEDADKLRENGVDKLLKWLVAAAEVKASVHGATKRFLDAAAEEARKPKKSSAPRYLEGCYESVHNARWHHVVEVPGGEGTGMEVGKPEQSWTYRAVGDSLEKDDGVQQSGAPRPRLMVLTSEKGWTYSWKWKENNSTRDCHVNCEVDRVWQIVKGDLTEWFSSHGRTDFRPKRRLLIGTPGIGKSMAASSYLLYQLLQYDVEKLPAVAYSVGGNTTYVFDKTIKTVTRYLGRGAFEDFLYDLRHLKMKGYVIYDLTEKGRPASCFAFFDEWGMIVLSSPKVSNYDNWEKQEGAERIIMNCPDEMDVKAMCAWMKRDETAGKKAECWKMVKERMEKVGPIPRYIFDANEFIAHSAAIEDALDGVNSRDGEKHFTHGGVRLWYSENASQKLVRVVRGRGEVGAEVFLNAPISVCLERRVPHYFGKRDE